MHLNLTLFAATEGVRIKFFPHLVSSGGGGDGDAGDAGGDDDCDNDDGDDVDIVNDDDDVESSFEVQLTPK